MKQPRLYDPGYLAFLRTKPCCVCGRTPSEAAHIRIGFFALGMKPDDRDAVPLCARCHRKQHSMNETKFWFVEQNANPFHIAAEYYKRYGGTGGKPRTRKLKYKWPKRKIQNRSKKR